MSYYANYRKVVETAVQVLVDFGISQAPVQLKVFFETLHNEIKLIKYTSFMVKYGLSYEEVITYLDSELGSCTYDPRTERYVIYYNDTLSKPWCRFTIAHELGHYFLGHHHLAGTDVLSRTLISKPDYEEYEKEANVFARNLLSPAPLAWDLIQGRQMQNYDVEHAFNITSRAANMRINYIRRDLRDYSENMQKIVRRMLMRYQAYCVRCNTLLTQDANYCILCGSNRTAKSVDYNPLPKMMHPNRFGKFPRCTRCGNTDLPDYARYCMICGLPLVNICTTENQHGLIRRGHYNLSNARYCSVCGSSTLYHNYDVFDNSEVTTEMEYRDGIFYDPETMRVHECPVCHNTEFSDNADYCRICGTVLYNRCEGELQKDNWGNQHIDHQHNNPSNARFCEICGKRTAYFIQGILPDWRNYEPMEHDDYQPSIPQIPASDGFMQIPDAAINNFQMNVPVTIDDELPFD